MKLIRQHKIFQRPATKGFTLVEVLCAVALFGTVVVALYAGISSGFAVMESARENLRATQLMVEKFETIRLKTFENVKNEETQESYDYKKQDGFLYTVTTTVGAVDFTDTNYASSMKRVVVEVRWKSGGRERVRSMVSYVTQNGLQAYVL